MFTDVSGLIAFNPARLHTGVAVTDLDGDGRFEFVVAGFGCSNRVLRWSGGQLRDMAPPEFADADSYSHGLAAGDLDGDGREEIFILNATLPNRTDRLFKRLPDGRWLNLLEKVEDAQLRSGAAGWSVATIDRRGVGRYGFFIARNGGPMQLFEHGPDKVINDLAPPLELAIDTGGRGVLAAPLFSDHTDLVCVNENGPNLVHRNRGDGTFTQCAGPLGLADAGENGRAVTVFDPGDHGEFGLCWSNWDGPHRLMVRGSGDGAWKDHATPGLAFPSAASAVIAADFDNDGHDELFFNNLAEPNRLFRVRAEEGVSAARSPHIAMLDPGEALDPGGHGTGAAICDIDGDGVLELLVARGQSEEQPLALFKARAAANNWLRVRPLTRFNAPARGAVVRAEADGRIRIKSICAGSGYLSQMEPIAHFGFGPGGHADRVQVMWPDGSGVVLMNPGINRTITVPYPRG